MVIQPTVTYSTVSVSQSVSQSASQSASQSVSQSVPDGHTGTRGVNCSQPCIRVTSLCVRRGEKRPRVSTPVLKKSCGGPVVLSGCLDTVVLAGTVKGRGDRVGDTL